MSGQWRALLVKDDESVNESIVVAMRKDGYLAHSAFSMAEAMRLLWSQEYDVVICDLQAPDVNSLELLQWVSTYRPNTRFIIVGPADSEIAQSQALEAGAVGYLPRPLNIYALKEELRRLLQQTGFSANLDSFDLLDVIQIINMSHKTIALLVNVGLEERGLLGFREGELIYAEYGLLRGEEAFFALAAHKNGTIVHQPWLGQVGANVSQPLSRLILQALQYRSRFAHRYQVTGEQVAVSATASGSVPAVSTSPLFEDDDRPFQVLTEYNEPDTPFHVIAETPPIRNNAGLNETQPEKETDGSEPLAEPAKAWWMPTGKVPSIRATTAPIPSQAGRTSATPHLSTPLRGTELPKEAAQDGSTAGIPPASPDYPQELPSWLTEQGASENTQNVPRVRPSLLSGTAHIPATPRRVSPAVWQGPLSDSKVTGPIARSGREQGQQNGVHSTGARITTQLNGNPGTSPASAEWQPPTVPSSPLQSLSIAPRNSGAMQSVSTPPPETRMFSHGGDTSKQQATRQGYNYDALVLALQTLGYTVTGFIAAAVVTLDGQPIAQVAVDDLDISRVCRHFSMILKSVLQSLDQGAWGEYEDMVITSGDRRILMGLVGQAKNAFQVLITMRESDPVECLNVMANVESAISAALQPRSERA
jgi:CheY-like chemotaxis protein/predicted regulator of Ras-like GTPase activity (Roadblock/LC7/MglB family)